MKLAVFDLDGTLTEHVSADEKCFVQAFADAYGIDQLDRHWMDYEHITDSWVVGQVFRTKYGRAPAQAEIQQYIQCYVNLLAENARNTEDPVRQMPGAQSFLGNLGEVTGWRGAIATGGWRRSAMFKMTCAGMTTDHVPAAFAEDGPIRDRTVGYHTRCCLLWNAQVWTRSSGRRWDLGCTNRKIPATAVCRCCERSRRRSLARQWGDARHRRFS